MKNLTGKTLDIDNPGISCGSCHFASALEGAWSVENGRLVFRADSDPQPRRGPDFSSCGECGVSFSKVSIDWGRSGLPDHDLAAIQHTAIQEREREWADWQKEHG